jgi:predicted small secreted protein
MKRIILNLLLLSFVAGFLGACNTVAGAGKDVEKAGQEIHEEATEGH